MISTDTVSSDNISTNITRDAISGSEIKGYYQTLAWETADEDSPSKSQPGKKCRSKPGKKCKTFILNKRIESSPKIKSYDTDDKTIAQLLSLYYSLSSNERASLLNQLYQKKPKILGEMYLQLDQEKKEGFLKDICKNISPDALNQIYNSLSYL